MGFIHETPEVRQWLEGLGIVVNQTYRVVIDRRNMAMRVWQFARDDSGRFFRFGDDIVSRVPFDVSLSSIPDFVELDRYGAGPHRPVTPVTPGAHLLPN